MKIAGIEFTKYEYQQIINLVLNQDKKFLVKYNDVYQIQYSENAGLTATLVYKNKSKMPLISAGRHMILTAKAVNELIGEEIFI